MISWKSDSLPKPLHKYLEQKSFENFHHFMWKLPEMAKKLIYILLVFVLMTFIMECETASRKFLKGLIIGALLSQHKGGGGGHEEYEHHHHYHPV